MHISSSRQQWRCEESGTESTEGTKPLHPWLLRTISTAAAAALLVVAPSPAALADIQYVPADQAANQAKPLVLKQEVNKNLVWEVLIGGAVVLFGTTVLLENNEALFPAIYRANQAMKMYGEVEEAQQQAVPPEAMEVEAAEVPLPELEPPQAEQVMDPLTASVLDGINEASAKTSGTGKQEEAEGEVVVDAGTEAAAAAAASMAAASKEKEEEAAEEKKEAEKHETSAKIGTGAETPEEGKQEATAEKDGAEEKEEAKTYPSELSVDAEETPSAASGPAAAAEGAVEAQTAPREAKEDDVSLDALEAALAAKLKQEEERKGQPEPPSLDALEAALEAKLKAEKDEGAATQQKTPQDA